MAKIVENYRVSRPCAIMLCSTERSKRETPWKPTLDVTSLAKSQR
jgi:hypothetical protein